MSVYAQEAVLVDNGLERRANADLTIVMQSLADEFCNVLAQCGGHALAAPRLPVHGKELRWRNWLFESALFRRAHVELFEIPAHFAVVHLCVLPHIGDPAPIFGFDMIGGRAQATGIFLDFSAVAQRADTPVLSDVISQAERSQFMEPRAAPDWGHVFSPDFFAIKPADPAEITAALILARRGLNHYLRHLGGCRIADPAIIAGQSAYALAQRRNPHTVRMLTRYVGAEAARDFVEEILFPLAETECSSSHFW